MSTPPSTSPFAVVIPAYNEAQTLPLLIEQTLAFCSTVIVINDGSTDNTDEVLASLPIDLISNKINRGKGASIVQGFALALQKKVTGVFTIDGDGQHNPMDLPQLIAKAESHPDDLIVAARLLNNERAPKARLRANHIADFWISWAAGQKIPDTQSGYRYYPTSLIKKLQYHQRGCPGFVFESEILIETARHGITINHVPIPSLYPKTARESHYRPFMDTFAIFRMVSWKLISRGMYIPGLITYLKS